MNSEHPLVIVFYLDADLMTNKQIIAQFAESVNYMFDQKKINAIAFFIPTKGEERVECINPVILKGDEIEKVNKLIKDIEKSFAIKEDIDVKDEMIDLTEKPCDCGNNPDGKCECE